jgi:hypothetical protein
MRKTLPPPPFKLYVHDSVGGERRGNIMQVVQGFMTAAASATAGAAARGSRAASCPQVCSAVGGTLAVAARQRLTLYCVVGCDAWRTVRDGLSGR